MSKFLHENSKSKKGHNFVKKKLKDYLPYWYGLPIWK